MDQKECERVVSTIEQRLDDVIKSKYPMAAKMVPAEIKAIIKDALRGSYASGFNHGEQKGVSNGATK